MIQFGGREQEMRCSLLSPCIRCWSKDLVMIHYESHIAKLRLDLVGL